MTRDDIIRMAREAGFNASIGKTDKDGVYHHDVNALRKDVPIEWIERFAALVAAAEREREREHEHEKASVYGFFWSDYLYESGPMLQSLHSSKAGALRAMIASQAARWDACRSGADSGLHLNGLGTFKARDYLLDHKMEAFSVRTIRLLP